MTKQNLFDDKSKKKDRVSAVLGTTIFYAGLLVIFLIFGFKTELPKKEEAGAFVILGETDFGSTQTSPVEIYQPKTEPQETMVEESQPVETQDEIITNDNVIEPAVDTKTEDNKTKTDPKEKPETKPDEDAQEITEDKEPERTSNKAYELGPINTNPGQGDDNTPGTKGSENGNKTATKYGPGGGLGPGVSFSLRGRSVIKGPPKISGKNQRTETVVIEITVNKNGQVIKAKISSENGASIMSGPLAQKALEAAKEMKFSENSNVFDVQVGYVTFKFKPFK